MAYEGDCIILKEVETQKWFLNKRELFCQKRDLMSQGSGYRRTIILIQTKHVSY